MGLTNEINNRITIFLNLLRVKQWYKNLLVFLALFFSANLFNKALLIQTIIAFFSLSLVSSAGYIINDLIDKEKDQKHPEKKNRPLASGKISTVMAIILCLLLLFSGLGLSLLLDHQFIFFLASLFGLTLLYSLYLKRIVFADILTIASLFTLRALSGALAINVPASVWLMLCPFFLALFLTVGKRHSDLIFLKNKASETRETLSGYNLVLTNSVLNISTTCLIISYALYSFLSEHQSLWYSLPLAIFVIFRYYYLILEGSVLTRHSEKIFKDQQVLIGIILWILVVGMLVYW